jgi:hypothetical protein
MNSKPHTRRPASSKHQDVAPRIVRMHLLIEHLCGPPADIMWSAASEWFYGQMTCLPGAASSEWFDERGRLMADEAYANALRAVVDTIKLPLPRPYDSDFLAFASDFLTYLAWVTVVSSKASNNDQRHIKRTALEKSWAAKTGKSWKALREFPKRIKGMASEIELMNANPFFRLERLPTIMRREVEYLEERLRMLPGLQAEAFPRTSPLDGLRRLVESWTGQPRAGLVAELHYAANAALGGQERQYSEAAVYQARYRAKKKQRT